MHMTVQTCATNLPVKVSLANLEQLGVIFSSQKQCAPVIQVRMGDEAEAEAEALFLFRYPTCLRYKLVGLRKSSAVFVRPSFYCEGNYY